MTRKSSPHRSPLFGRTFRLNPLYRLTPLARLPADMRRRLRAIAEEGGAWGVLHSADGRPLPVKTVGAEAAALLRGLRRPRAALEAPGAEASPDFEAFLRRQLVDAVLEVSVDGAFASGPAALERVAPARPVAPAANELERLSHRAILLGYDGPWTDPLELSARLYFYNRIPIHEGWRRRYPDADALSRALGGTDDARMVDGFWWAWRLRDPEASPGACTFKLYVSPRPEQLCEVFGLVRARAAGSRAHSMKTAMDLRGLLRPDKLVLYFTRWEDALELGSLLARELRGAAAHGVPFTCALDGSGLVSWGADPPRSAQYFEWQKGESWRLAVTNRLSRAILAARAQPPADPLSRILAAARESGIDPAQWKPAAGWEAA